MKRAVRNILLTALLAAGCSSSVQGAPPNQPAPRPTTQPATTQPAARPAPVDPKARALLVRLEAAGKKFNAIRSMVTYTSVNKRLGDSEVRTGWVAWQNRSKKVPARFRIHFDDVVANEGRKTKDSVDYGFDGRWLTVIKHRIKQIIRYEVVKPGSKADPLKLGKGPFPVPFGQETEEVLKTFAAGTRAPLRRDPEGTDYLKLVPLPHEVNRQSFTRL